MQSAEAIRIVEALMDGFDPVTGELLPDTSPYNRPEVIRALARALDAMRRAHQNEKRKRFLPPNAGKAWTKEEDHRLAEEFDKGLPAKEIAAKHDRTRGSIAARLVRIGKVSERDEVL
jgi:hypothetical protein